MKSFIVVAFLSLITVTSAPPVQADEAVKAMMRSMNGPNDAGLCDNVHSPAEKRIEFCLSALRARFDDGIEFTLATLYQITGDHDAALRAARIVLPVWPADFHPQQEDRERRVAALEIRSTLYAQMGRFEEAKADADEIEKTGLDTVRAANEQCWIRAVAGVELDKATKYCKEALASKPSYATALDSLGLVDFKLGHLQDALTDYDAALDEDRRLNSSRFARGVVKLRLGDESGGSRDMADATNREVDIARLMAGYGLAPPSSSVTQNKLP